MNNNTEQYPLEEAEQMGAFQEDALNEADAMAATEEAAPEQAKQ